MVACPRVPLLCCRRSAVVRAPVCSLCVVGNSGCAAVGRGQRIVVSAPTWEANHRWRAGECGPI